MIEITTIGVTGMRKDTYESLKDLFGNIGVLKRGGIKKPVSYSAVISENGEHLKLGDFLTEQEAHEAVISHQIERFIKNASQYTDISQIYPCIDRGYFVTPSGLIITRFGTKVRGWLSTTGYLRTNIWVNRTHKFRTFHRMIAESLIPNPDNLPCINHKNGIKTDNRVENLEWCSYSDNTRHAYATGLERKRYGEELHNHKLTNDAVKDIRVNCQKGSKIMGVTYFAKKYNVDKSVIRDVIDYKTWRHI